MKATIETSNFEPINILQTLKKVIELAVHNQLEECFENNNLFLGHQSGFQSKHSCEIAVHYTIIEWKKHLDEGNYIVSIFLDFKRAFETIEKSILLAKLSFYGIGGRVLIWFKNYLENRRQISKVQKEFMNDLGVPQGSVLGPLLFIIYLNGIYHIPSTHSIDLFADDTFKQVFIRVQNDCIY